MIATNEFTTAMQQLSAEAEKTLPPNEYGHETDANGAV